jgi:serine O-acetyltransferase
MRLSLTCTDLVSYVARQFEALFPDGGNLDDLGRYVTLALERVEYGFSRLRLKGYFDDSGPRFSHRHSDQYAVFLYYLSNTAFVERPGHPIADKAFALNKALHGLDAYYEAGLPNVFAVQHPVGTVLGRADYADYFLCYQNCTVGANLDNEYPALGRGVVMYGGSRVIGRTSIGDNTLISVGATLMDAGAFPGDSVLRGIHPNASRSTTRRNVVREIFGAAL